MFDTLTDKAQCTSDWKGHITTVVYFQALLFWEMLCLKEGRSSLAQNKEHKK